MRITHVLALAMAMSLTTAARAPGGVTLSYDFNDGQGGLAHHKSDSTNNPTATAIAGGTEYVFAFGNITNGANWNWAIRGGGQIVLDVFANGATLKLVGPKSDKPLVINYNGPDRRFSDQVVLDFKATFDKISAPLIATASFAGDLASMNGYNPNGSAPTMDAYSNGSGKFTTLDNGDTKSKAEPKDVTSLEGVINLKWNTNISANGDTFTVTTATVMVATPEPATFIGGVFAVLGVLGWRRANRKD